MEQHTSTADVPTAREDAREWTPPDVPFKVFGRNSKLTVEQFLNSGSRQINLDFQMTSSKDSNWEAKIKKSLDDTAVIELLEFLKSRRHPAKLAEKTFADPSKNKSIQFRYVKSEESQELGLTIGLVVDGQRHSVGIPMSQIRRLRVLLSDVVGRNLSFMAPGLTPQQALDIMYPPANPKPPPLPSSNQ